MKAFDGKRILLIDHQFYWRDVSAEALRSAGFIVCTLNTYHYLPPQACLEGKDPDLVVLGCVCIGPEEQKLIAQILAHKHHLLVLCVSLPFKVMRSLFLQGVDDVVAKPYDSAYLISLVHQALESTQFRNSYQAVERNGVS